MPEASIRPSAKPETFQEISKDKDMFKKKNKCESFGRDFFHPMSVLPEYSCFSLPHKVKRKSKNMRQNHIHECKTNLSHITHLLGKKLTVFCISLMREHSSSKRENI